LRTERVTNAASRPFPGGNTGNTGYTQAMAKVMISMPDELLAQVDRRARQEGTTRSAWLQDVTRRALSVDELARAERIRAFLDSVRPRGGNSAEAIRADRDRDNP